MSTRFAICVSTITLNLQLQIMNTKKQCGDLAHQSPGYATEGKAVPLNINDSQLLYLMT